MSAMQVHVVRLAPGDDLRPALEAEILRQGIAAACVLSAVGSFTQAVLRYAEASDGTELAGPLEMVSLAGTLGPDGAHLHTVVSDAQGSVRGGHVMAGCVVRTTAEVVLAIPDGWDFRRETDEATGYQELMAKRI